MVNKRVGVRLVAENGRRVKAELEGIGEAGERSFGRIEKSAETVRRVVRRVFGALTAGFSVRALGDMAERYTEIGNTLRVLGIEQDQVGAAIQQLGDIARRTRSPLDAMASLYQRVSMAAGEMGVSQQDILRFTENIGLALAQQGGSAQQASGALLQLSQALGGTNVRAEEFNSIQEGAFPILLAAARGIDEAGGSVARLRQMVVEGRLSSDEFFRAILSQTEELEATFANTLPTIGQAWQVLVDSITLYVGASDSAVGVSSAIAQAVLTVANNVERLAIYATTFATFMAGKWVAGMKVAGVSVISLSGALTLLRGAIIRTGIGALIVGAGELIYWFGQLVKGAGGFGNAVGLVGDVARAVFSEMDEGGQALVAVLEAAAWSIARGFVDAFKWIFDQWTNLLETMYGPFNALMERVGSEFRLSVPNPIGDMLGGASDWLGSQAGEALNRAGEIYAGMEQTRGALAALVEAVNRGSEDGSGALDGTREAAGRVTDALNDAGDAGSAAGKKIKEAGEEAKTGWAKTLETLQDYAASAKDLAGGIGDAIVGAFQSAENAVVEFVKKGKLNFTDMVTSFIADLARLAVRRFILGPISDALDGILGGPANPLAFLAPTPAPSFAGGGHTGYGARTGGLDGRGGYLAMVHPRERIIDEYQNRNRGRATGDMPGVVINIQTRDAESFRRSRTQVAADIQRAVAMGRRGM